jgi:hypothetical protein
LCINFLVGRLLVPDTAALSTGNTPIAFYAYLSHHMNSVGVHHILTFDTAITNAGNAYHPISGTFIAPRSDLYVFTWTIRMHGNAFHAVELMVNNNAVGHTFLNSGNAIDGSVLGTVVVHVHQGDDVLVRTTTTNTGWILSDVNSRSSFAGWALM